MPTGNSSYRRSSRGRARERARGGAAAAGWLRPDQSLSAETVVARLDRTDLPEALTAVHAQGLGHTARVLDPGRGEILQQFARAGIAADLGFARMSVDDVFILVNASGRAALVGDLLLRHRAREVRVYRAADTHQSDPVTEASDSIAEAAGDPATELPG